MLLQREVILPNFQGTHMSTDIWECICGSWRRADEQCVHLVDRDVIDTGPDRIIDFRAEKI